MIRNVAGQTTGAGLVNATTGAAFAGAVTVYVTGDAGVQAIGSVGSGLCTLEGNGYYSYRPSQAETDYAAIAFTYVGAGAVPVSITVPTITLAQASALASSSVSTAVAILTIITNALLRFNVYQPGASIKDADSAYCLDVLNDIFDSWNAKAEAVWADSFTTYTLTPALQPHEIGPTGDFVVASRPVDLESVYLMIGTVAVPVTLRSADWWEALSVPTLTSSIPTDCYYQPDVPDGGLYFWPVPTTAYDVVIRVRTILAQVSLTDTLSFPPGYRNALTLTLMEGIAETFGRVVSPKLERDARIARGLIFDNNVVVPTLDLQDGQGDAAVGSYNYLTGGRT